MARNDGTALVIELNLAVDVFPGGGWQIECPSTTQVWRVHVLIREKEPGTRGCGRS
jgi:hypothetical protein